MGEEEYAVDEHDDDIDILSQPSGAGARDEIREEDPKYNKTTQGSNTNNKKRSKGQEECKQHAYDEGVSSMKMMSISMMMCSGYRVVSIPTLRGGGGRGRRDQLHRTRVQDNRIK